MPSLETHFNIESRNPNHINVDCATVQAQNHILTTPKVQTFDPLSSKASVGSTSIGSTSIGSTSTGEKNRNIFWSDRVEQFRNTQHFFETQYHSQCNKEDDDNDNEIAKGVCNNQNAKNSRERSENHCFFARGIEYHRLKKYWILEWIKTYRNLLESLSRTTINRVVVFYNNVLQSNVNVSLVPKLKYQIQAEWKWIVNRNKPPFDPFQTSVDTNHDQNNSLNSLKTDNVTLVLVAFSAVVPSVATTAAEALPGGLSNVNNSGFLFSFANAFDYDAVINYQLENSGTCSV